MNFIIDNWYMIIAAAAILALAGIGVYAFIKTPRSAQIEKIQKWLLYAVVEAEKQLGGGTGQIKLRMVYDMFVGRFPSVAQMITYDTFSTMVDNALAEMENLLKSNKNLADYVNNANV